MNEVAQKVRAHYGLPGAEVTDDMASESAVSEEPVLINITDTTEDINE